MNINTGRQLKNKARYIYGLAEILKCDIDILRKDAADCDLNRVRESIYETDKTLQKLFLAVGEIEYILNLDKNEGP